MTFLKFQTHLLYDSTISIFGRSNVQSAIDKFFSSAVVRHWYCFNEFIITRIVGFGHWFRALDSGFGPWSGPRPRFRNKTQPECQKHVTNYKYNWAPFGKPMLKTVLISNQSKTVRLRLSVPVRVGTVSYQRARLFWNRSISKLFWKSELWS